MSIDTLFNTSWQVLIGVAIFWWTMFAALRLQLRNSSASTLQDKLETLARPFSRSASPVSMVERWRTRLENVGVTFTLNKSAEMKLVAVKWFLCGLLVTGLIILLAQIIMFGSEKPAADEMAALRLMSIASLITSGLIAAAILIAALFCDGARAIKDLAIPSGLYTPHKGGQV